jgi:hypothetical protein
MQRTPETSTSIRVCTLPSLAQALRFDLSGRDLPLAYRIEIPRSVQMLALLPITRCRPRDVSPQHDVIPEIGRHFPMRLAVNDALDEALPWQLVGLDAKPNVIQQEQKRTPIHHAAAHRDLREFPLATLGNTVAPGAVISVETDQPGTRIDVQFLRYPRATPESSPSIRKINQPPSQMPTSIAMKSRICW